jgi:hypothetical protein
MGAAMGHTVRTIAYQFKSNNEGDKVGDKGIISRVINKANNTESKPVGGVSYENYSKNIMEEPNAKSITNNISSTENKTNNIQNEGKNSSTINGMKKAYNVGKEFMNLGMYMAEGKNFKTSGQEQIQKRIYNRNNINNTRQEDKKEEENKITTVEVDDASD